MVRYVYSNAKAVWSLHFIVAASNFVKGSKIVGALDPNTVEFNTIDDEESSRSAELKEELDAAEERFEAARSEVLSAECSICDLGLYCGYKLDTRLFDWVRA